MPFDDIRNMSPTEVGLLRGLTYEMPYEKEMKTPLGSAANSPSSDKGIEPLDMPPAAMSPAAMQSAPMDHDIHIDLLNRLFKHIHSASSLPTLAHQFGEFVIEQIEEELKHDIQKKKSLPST